MDQKKIHRYFRGNLEQSELEAFLDWVDASEENREQLRQERLLFDAALFTVVPKLRKKRTFHAVTKAMGIAAGLLILLALGVFLQNALKQPAVTASTVYVPGGQRSMVTLADGTVVWLNSNTTLTYSSDYGKKERTVSINGEGYFEVTPNPQIPFCVKTPKNTVRVTGTTFNVYAYSESEWFETSLVEGVVEVLPTDHRHKTVVLKPNETLAILYGQYQMRSFQSEDFLLWREGIYHFDDMPFSEILKRLERYYNIRIVVENPRVMNYRCTGKFKQQDGIRHILTVIRKDHRFDFNVNEDGDVVTVF